MIRLTHGTERDNPSKFTITESDAAGPSSDARLKVAVAVLIAAARNRATVTEAIDAETKAVIDKSKARREGS